MRRGSEEKKGPATATEKRMFYRKRKGVLYRGRAWEIEKERWRAAAVLKKRDKGRVRLCRGRKKNQA